jgi:hypothetical protein
VRGDQNLSSVLALGNLGIEGATGLARQDHMIDEWESMFEYG